MLKKIVLIIGAVAGFGLLAMYGINYLMWQIPPSPETHAVELADLDGDGDLDAFLANGRNEVAEPNTVLWNDGTGKFQDSGQQVGNFESRTLALADFDGDGDSDALVGNSSWGEYFWNDGQGRFGDGQFVAMPATEGYYVGLWRFRPADLNGDGNIDIFLTGCCGGGLAETNKTWHTLNASNAIWLGDNSGLPQNNVMKFGFGGTESAALADLDGDLDLDAFLANSAHMDEQGDMLDFDPNEVWFNNGSGIFSSSEQQLGSQRSYVVALGDIDGDGDADALVGNNGPDEIWTNDGRGLFSLADQGLESKRTRYIYLGDLDGDYDLDAFIGGDYSGRIWTNNGRGQFSDSGQLIDYSPRHAVAVGDVNGDGAADIVAGKLDAAVVWINDGAGKMVKVIVN